MPVPDPNLSNYPEDFDAFDLRHSDDVIEAAHVNQLQDAVTQVETLLGAYPVDPEHPGSGRVFGFPNMREFLEHRQPGGGGGGSGQLVLRGLALEDTSSTAVQISCSSIRVPGGEGGDAVWGYTEVEVDLNDIPPNHDPALGAGQWWAIFLMLDSTGQHSPLGKLVYVDDVASLVPEDYPTGYDTAERVGTLLTYEDNGIKVVGFAQFNNRVYYKEPQPAWGASVASVNWTSVNLGGCMPPTAVEATLMVRVSCSGADGIGNMNVKLAGSSSERGLLSVQTGNSGADTDFATGIMPILGGDLEYRVGGDASQIDAEGLVLGYFDRFIPF